MIKLSVNETKWSSLLARTRALILYISIWIFDFGPEKLPGLSRNGPLDSLEFWIQRCGFRIPSSRTGFRSLMGFRIPWAVYVFGILWAKFSRIPYSLTWGEEGLTEQKIVKMYYSLFYQQLITSLPRFDDCPLYHRWLQQQAMFLALGGIGTGKMKITSGSRMTLHLMDMPLTTLAANVLRGNTWQVRNPPFL